MDGQRQDVVVYVDDGLDINNHLSLVVCARDRSGCEVQVVCAIQQEVFMTKGWAKIRVITQRIMEFYGNSNKPWNG